MKSFLRFITALIIIGVLAGIAWAGYAYIMLKKHLPLFTPIETTKPNAEVIPMAGEIKLFETVLQYPASSTVDTTLWKTYVHEKFHFEVSYPANMITNGDESTTILAFPKDAYFSWPLLDDVKITIAASSTCPVVENAAANSTTSLFMLNGHEFTRWVSQDVAAGNRYIDVMYTTTVDGTCYSLHLSDHGSNGAGLYVDDQELIKRYDLTHTDSMKKVLDVFNTITAKFQVTE